MASWASLDDLSLDNLVALEEADEKATRENDRRILALRPAKPAPKAGIMGRKRRRNPSGSVAASAAGKKEGEPLKRNDVVWILMKQNLKDEDDVSEVTDDDLRQTAEHFQDRGLYIWASLGVVRVAKVKALPGKSKKEKGLVASISYVYDSSNEEQRTAEKETLMKTCKVAHRFLHRYEPIFTKNKKILAGVEASIQYLLNRHDFFRLKCSLNAQADNVKEFFRLWLNKTQKAEPHKFLLANSADRKRYENALFGAEVLDDVLDDLLLNSQYQKIDVNREADDEEEESKDEKEDDSKREPVKSEEEEEDAFPKLEQPSKLNEGVVAFFQTDVAVAHLKNVMSGIVSSQRHDLMTRTGHYSLGIKSSLFYLSNANFLDDDDLITDNRLLAVVGENVFEPSLAALKVNGALASMSDLRQSFKRDYIWHCLIPEGIILYLQENGKNGTDTYESAEHFFLNMDQRKRRKYESNDDSVVQIVDDQQVDNNIPNTLVEEKEEETH